MDGESHGLRAWVAAIVTVCVTSVCVGGNILENSSFECGNLRGWSYAAYGHNVTAYLDFDTAVVEHGGKALKLQYDNSTNATYLASRPYRLLPNASYTLTFWAKADPGNTAVNSLDCQVWNTYNQSGIADFNFGTTITTSWARYTNAFTTGPGRGTNTYYINLGPHWGNGSGTTYTNQWLWVDALQLEQGTTNSYSPVSPIEIGGQIDATHPANIFYDTQQAQVTVVVYNNTANSSNVVVNWNQYDYWNALRASGTSTFSMPAGGSTNTIPMPGSGRGAFRCVFWMNGVASSANEVSYLVVAPPVSLAANTNSHFGVHVGPVNGVGLSAAPRLGARWNRQFYEGQWKIAEPANGTWAIDTNQLALTRSYGLEPVLNTPAGQLNATWNAPDIPGYGTNTLDFWPDNTKMSNFWFALASTNKPFGRYYEIGNEYPNTGEYTNHLIYAAAIKAADPTAYIVAPADSGFTPYMSNALRIVSPSLIDFWSLHLYPFQNDWTLRTIPADAAMSHYGKVGWNSETGLRFDSFYKTYPWYEIQTQPTLLPTGNGYTRNYRWRTPLQVDNFVNTMGLSIHGVYFYYDFRTTGGFDGDIAFSLLDFNNTAQPFAATYSWLAQLFEKATPFGPFSLNNSLVECFYHTNGQQCIVTLLNQDMMNAGYANDPVSYNSTNVLRSILVTSSQSATFYDAVGNVISAPVRLGSSPVFVVGAVGVSTNALLSGLSVTAIADTNTPNLAVSVWPTYLASSQFTWEWSAGDDTCFNTWTNANTNAIQFSYQLVPVDAGWSAWTNAPWASYTGLTPGANYTMLVRAKDAAGNVAQTSASTASGPYQIPAGAVMNATTGKAGTMTLKQ